MLVFLYQQTNTEARSNLTAKYPPFGKLNTTTMSLYWVLSTPLLKAFQLLLHCTLILCHSFPAMIKLCRILCAAFILSGCLSNLLFLFFNFFF